LDIADDLGRFLTHGCRGTGNSLSHFAVSELIGSNPRRRPCAALLGRNSLEGSILLILRCAESLAYYFLRICRGLPFCCFGPHLGDRRMQARYPSLYGLSRLRS